VLATHDLLTSGASVGLQLALGIAVGAATYAGVMWLGFGTRVRQIAAALRRLRR